MVEKIELLEDTDVVYASWNGPITGEQRHEFRDQIMELCEKNNTTKFIVDLRKQSTGTDIKDNYNFGRQLRRKMSGYTIAAIYNRSGLSEDMLIDTVQRGDVKLQVFYNFEDAKAWITNQ